MIALMKRILAVSGKHKGRIQGAFVFCFFKSMLSKAPMMLSFFALAAFYENTADKKLCLWLGVGMVSCLLLQILFHHISDRMQSAAGYMVFADMRIRLGQHLRKMPMGYFTEGNIGKISSVLSSDMVFIEENCMMILADLMSYLFAQAVMIVFLLFFNPWLGLAAAAVVFLIWLVAQGMQWDALAHSDIRQEQNEKLTDAVLDFTEGVSIIKTYNLLGGKSKELTENFERTCETSLEFERNQVPWSRRLNLLYGLGPVAVLAAAFVLGQSGRLSVIYLVGMLLFAMELFGPIKALYGNFSRLSVMNSCMDRVEGVFGEKELPDEGTQSIPADFDGPEVEFKNVSFGYNEKEILHDISFALPKNRMLALVGPSGGGKSTIASLLARFWDIQSGEILIRGRDVRNVKLSDLMDHISMVFQRVYLFQDTIYNNISMGRPDAAREAVLEAARKARCYDFIMALPDGFDTIIGEGGASLSGGEKQRISIARCILKDAPVVILDEATANVDADNESYIQEAISELCRGKTLLVIAHRLNTIRSADQILVIADGSIAQAGTHETLIEKDGIYRSFVTVRENSRGWSRRSAG